jgi:hypothetical protein
VAGLGVSRYGLASKPPRLDPAHPSPLKLCTLWPCAHLLTAGYPGYGYDYYGAAAAAAAYQTDAAASTAAAAAAATATANATAAKAAAAAKKPTQVGLPKLSRRPSANLTRLLLGWLGPRRIYTPATASNALTHMYLDVANGPIASALQIVTIDTKPAAASKPTAARSPSARAAEASAASPSATTPGAAANGADTDSPADEPANGDVTEDTEQQEGQEAMPLPPPSGPRPGAASGPPPPTPAEELSDFQRKMKEMMEKKKDEAEKKASTLPLAIPSLPAL